VAPHCVPPLPHAHGLMCLQLSSEVHLQLLKNILLLVDNQVLYARGTRDAGANGACTRQTSLWDNLTASIVNAPKLLDLVAARILAYCSISSVGAPAGALDGLLALGICCQNGLMAPAECPHVRSATLPM
jgi:hypothetical protein